SRMSGHRRPKLSNHQKALARILDERNSQLQAIYLGSLRVLSDISNPDRYALGAHAFRELLDRLPEYIDLPIPGRASLMEKVQDLHRRGEALRKKPPFCANGWAGPVDKVALRFFEQSEKFFDWFRRDRPSRKAAISGLLARLAPRRIPLPQPIAILHV